MGLRCGVVVGLFLVGAVSAQTSGGLHGYIGLRIEAPPVEFGFGASYHATAWPLIPEPIAGFQIGLPSTWIVPDNRGYREPLCPKGTVARDNWPERGPSYGSVFQTIEGGLGFWVSTRFPSAVPKYRMNGTPTCYSHEVSSPGFGFGRTKPLAHDEFGLAQLSNRIVVPPDGFTLVPGTGHELIGSAWMALPLLERRGPHHLVLVGGESAPSLAVDQDGHLTLTPSDDAPHQVWLIEPAAAGTVQITLAPDTSAAPRPLDPAIARWRILADGDDLVLRDADSARTLRAPGRDDTTPSRWQLEPVAHDESAPTGDLAWTFFLDAANFRGPVAFWIPQAWSAIADGYPPAAGRTLDCKVGEMGSGAMEVNTVPLLEARSADGRHFTKIPAIHWPVDDAGHSWLMQDVRFYSPRALAQGVRNWFHGGEPVPGDFLAAGTMSPRGTANPLRLRQGSRDHQLPLDGLDERMKVVALPEGGCAYGIQWLGSDRSGALPQYYVERDGKMVPVDAVDVPPETGLVEARFRAASRGHAYVAPDDPTSDWQSPGPAAGPFTIELGDFSAVTYHWYRFIDQPALQRFAWSADERAELQRRAELIHRHWRIDGRYLAPVSRGKLAEIEPQQIVTPPKGMEIGFVPIVTRQRDVK